MEYKLLFMLSGSISCYKACHVISRLAQKGVEIQVVASAAALKFLGEATLESLSGRPILKDTFTPGRMMDHIYIDRWADGVVLCPATANTINKFALGIGDDLLSTLFLAHDRRKPFLIFPAMNSQMLTHPSVQASIRKLEDWGVEVFSTENGVLACGEQGEGKLLDPDRIAEEIWSHLTVTHRSANHDNSELAAKPLRILITSGGTREPIDGIRYIGNQSTGATGAWLADHFARRGHEVTVICAESSVRPSRVSYLETFTSFGGLDLSLQNVLNKHGFDVVIHAAAVSDFSVSGIVVDGQRVKAATNWKLPSGQEICIELKPNQKLISKLRSYARDPNFKLIGFKLTNGATNEQIERSIAQVFEKSDVEAVIHNDWSQMQGCAHPASLWIRTANGFKKLADMDDKAAIAHELENFFVLNRREDVL